MKQKRQTATSSLFFACILVSLFFVFSLCFLVARSLVRPELWLSSISKQPICVLTLICHAWRLQLSNEACAIQQEVQRKSTQELLRTSQHRFNVKIGLTLVSNMVSTRKQISQHGLNVKIGLTLCIEKKKRKQLNLHVVSVHVPATHVMCDVVLSSTPC